MKIKRTDNVKWVLDDEGLIDTLAEVVSKETAKRGYFPCDYNGKKIFVKFFREAGISGFIRNKVLPRGKKEYRAGKDLIARSIMTPRPLGYGSSTAGSYIVEEWIDGDAFVNAFANAEDRTGLLLQLADLLKQLKTCKVLHNDLHLYNIIVRGNDLYIIDLHKMVIKRRFGLEDEASNLAHAITMIYDAMSEQEKRLFFERYGNEGIRSPVEKEMHRLWERWIRKKQKRAFDNTSKIIAKGDYAYLNNGKAFADAKVLQLLKQDKKTTIERYNDHIRKYYRNRRRLRRAWKNHVTLEYLNLSITPKAYCVRLPALSSTGYIAMEDVGPAGEELDRYLDRTYDNMDEKGRRLLVAGLARFFVGLFHKKVFHRDVKACNIFMSKGDGFLLLDVEDIVFAPVNGKRLKRMLVQLNTTIPRRIGPRDRMRFYLKLVKELKVDRKRIFQDVKRESLTKEIAYEGVGGLKKESW